MTYKTIVQNMVHNTIIEKTRAWFEYSGDWEIRTLKPADIDLHKDGTYYDTDGYISVTATNTETWEIRVHLAWAFVANDGDINVFFREA